MTNHIEELMKAAGVWYSVICTPVGANCKAGCDNCKRRKILRPVFTPKKQLDLIKSMGKRENYGSIGEQIDYFMETRSLTFEEAIARITSNAISSKILYKSEVKRILEDANQQ